MGLRAQSRFPARQRKFKTVRLDSALTHIGGLGVVQPLGHQLDQVSHPARVTPLVVVPRCDLHAIPVDHFGETHIDDCGTRVASKINRDQRFFAVSKDVFEWAVRSLPEGAIDILNARWCFDEDDQVNQRHIRCGHPQGVAIQFAFQLRQDQPTALAAPVVVGMMERQAARARRKSLWG